MDLPWKPFFFSLSHTNGLKCTCFLNLMCWKFFNLFPLFSPPLKVLHSVSIHYVFYLPPAPPSWEVLMLLLVLKNGTLKVWEGRNPTLQPAVLSRLPLETVPSVPRCARKCFTAPPSYWVASREENGVLTLPFSDSVPHFGLHTGKEANLLASKPTTQLYAVVTQTMDINLKIWGKGEVEYSSYWNLKSPAYLISLFPATWRKSDWWGSLRIWWTSGINFRSGKIRNTN